MYCIWFAPIYFSIFIDSIALIVILIIEKNSIIKNDAPCSIPSVMYFMSTFMDFISLCERNNLNGKFRIYISIFITTTNIHTTIVSIN